MSRKLLVTDARGERELPLAGTVVVGRDPNCQISYDDPQLSRRHAEFVVSNDAVIVRDLGSRNGIMVNGVKVGEARLIGGDVVQIANMRVRFVDNRPRSAIGAGAADGSDHKTILHPKPPTPAGPIDDDKTRLVAPPVFTPPPARAGAVAPASTAGEVSLRPTPVPASMPAPVQVPSLRKAETKPPRDAAATSSKGDAGSAEVAPSVEAERKARIARTSWGGRVLIQVMGLAAVVFLIAAVPLSLFQNRLLNATATSRAVALVNWLAADASAALQTAGTAVNAADDVSREAGVVTALILTIEGRIIAPASRGTESVGTIPGIGVPPSEILRLRTAWNGDLVEVARPVRTRDRPRAAVAWITFRPSAPVEAGSSVILLGAAVFFALLAGFAVATTIRRMTLKALTVLNEDIELAVGGQLQGVGDPLGAKPVKDLADSVNYLVARLKAGDAEAPRVGLQRPAAAPAAAYRPAAAPSDTRPVRAQAPAPVSAAAASRESAGGGATAPARDARIVANAKFRVTEASAGCAEMLGVRPDKLVGAHLVDAIPDGQLVDAVLKCLSALPGGGEEKSVVTPSGKPYRVSVTVSRAAKDQPITIVMVPVA